MGVSAVPSKQWLLASCSLQLLLLQHLSIKLTVSEGPEVAQSSVSILPSLFSSSLLRSPPTSVGPLKPTVSQSCAIKTMAPHMLLLLAAFALTSFVHQVTSFSTGRCREEQLLKILTEVKSCSANLRWSSDYCDKHAQIEKCLERAFQSCFSNSVAQKLVRGEKARLRLKIEAEWGNKIQVEELEKLFKGCTYIADRPPPGLLQRLHWVDFVRTDGSCDYNAKEEVKKWLSFESPLTDSSNLANCLSEKEANFVLEEMRANVENAANMKENNSRQREISVQDPSPRKSSTSSVHNSIKVFLPLLLIIFI